MNKGLVMGNVAVIILICAVAVFFVPEFDEFSNWLYSFTVYTLGPWAFYFTVASTILNLCILYYVRRVFHYVKHPIAEIPKMPKPKKKAKKKKPEKPKLDKGDFEHA